MRQAVPVDELSQRRHLLINGNSLGCTCRAGFTGSTCETEVNACVPNPCQHDGVCDSRQGGFYCRCRSGYTGNKCHRPCTDVYQSCKRWKDEDRCDAMRSLTKFFDANCPVTCQQCSVDNTTIVDYPPYPPALEAFHYLIGVWDGTFYDRQKHPVDFDGDGGYTETIRFDVAEVPMFGTPSINYSSTAHHARNQYDYQLITGFLTLKKSPETTKLAGLLTTSNNGIIMIEEGAVLENIMELRSVYNASLPYLQSIVPKSSLRIFDVSGDKMSVRTTILDSRNQKREFTRSYTRTSRRNLY